jgi:endonuclease/exonuclease/phosphatase family metal-dependent hydrolase
MRTISFGVLWLLLSGTVVGAEQATTPPSGTATLPCTQETPGIIWMRWQENQSTLDRWCASVGAPVFRVRPTGDDDISRLLILSWNAHVGGGRIEELLPRLLGDRARTRTGLVVLLQETFRAGDAVPGSYPGDLRVPSAIRPRRPTLDVAGIADRFGLSVAYVPSMRNGPATSVEAREDRGNAVLSTEPLSDVRAIELPFGKQRRVAVAATVLPRRGGAGPMRVVTTHFDTNNARVVQSTALASRLAELTDMPMVIGGDLNARKGFHDGAVIMMGNRIPLLSCGTGRTNRWPLRLDVFAFFLGRLDFMFATPASSPDIQRTCETLRHSHHSDHVPLLLTIDY